MRKQTHTHTHVYIYIYTYTYIHTHASIFKPNMKCLQRCDIRSTQFLGTMLGRSCGHPKWAPPATRVFLRHVYIICSHPLWYLVVSTRKEQNIREGQLGITGSVVSSSVRGRWVNKGQEKPATKVQASASPTKSFKRSTLRSPQRRVGKRFQWPWLHNNTKIY